MDGDQQQQRKLAPKKRKRVGKRGSQPKAPWTQPQEHEPSLALSSSTVMPSQQPNGASTVPASLSRLLTVVMEKDDSFIFSVSANQSMFGLPSHKIIVAKERVHD